MPARPLSVNNAAARDRYNEAILLAKSDTELPTEWLQASRALSRCSSATFVPMLGTALLAKATNRQVSALALRQRDAHRGYSARQLAKNVLVPLSVEHGIDLRTHGAEPLNNSPFFREAVVSMDLGIRPARRSELDLLVKTLEQADFLEGQLAIAALAAFIRVRLELGRSPARLNVRDEGIDLARVINAAEEFLARNSDGGRRGQALAAACLAENFPKVVSSHINDPSARAPGDIAYFSDIDNEGPIGATEVKQREVSGTEIVQFAARLANAGIDRGFYICLAPLKSDLSVLELENLCTTRHGVQLRLILGARQLISELASWSPKNQESVTSAIVRGVVDWLNIFHADPESSSDWKSLISPTTSS